jgi:lipoprotein-anchoring transpeptidase ErfK/SrfK
VILRPGQSGAQVRELQARLRQIRWYTGDVTDYYGTNTTAAVKGFQAKRGYPATGVLDERTWGRLLSMSRKPTSDELRNVVPKPPPTKTSALTWDVDQRCLTGRVICISKSTRMLTWVIEGVPQYQFDVRFGSEALPTREGTFLVFSKQKDVISNLYFTPMPYSLFFSGGQAVHYSSNFARLGYNGSSHGCVNVRDWNGIVRLFNDSRIGDKVVVHW